MWRLLRDQVERSWRQIPVLAAVAVAAAMLGSSLGPLRVQPAGDPGRLFARLFIATFPVFAAASFGLLSTLTNSRSRPAAVVRILPVRRHQLARALALGAGMPGLIIGALVSALVILLHIGLGLGVSVLSDNGVGAGGHGGPIGSPAQTRRRSWRSLDSSLTAREDLPAAAKPGARLK